jgi:transposase
VSLLLIMDMAKVCKGYPSDVTDEEWWFVLLYLLPCREDVVQRDHDLRAVLNAVGYMARSGCSWRLIPNDLPPWYTVHQQFRRWLDAVYSRPWWPMGNPSCASGRGARASPR